MAQITEMKFYEILLDLKSGNNVKQVAVHFKLSERMVRYVKEAQTWERWPYILAKARCGYQTPEYYGYLGRRGLPKTPPKLPPKDTMVTTNEFLHNMATGKVLPGVPSVDKPKKRGLFARIFGRK